MAGRRLTRALLLLLFGTLIIIGIKRGASSSSSPLVVSCGSLGKELEVCREAAETWAKKTGTTVEVLASPGAAGERLAQYQLLLAAKSPDIDIFLIDTTWPGMLGDFFVDLRENAALQKESAEFFPSFIANNTVGGRLVALPWFIDAGLLYFRKDLLEKYGEKPPQTWRALTRIARKIEAGERAAGHDRFWGYVFQGRAYEGLTCNALEWIHNSGGGTLVDESGKITIDQPSAVQALALAAEWVQGPEPIAPRGVLNYMEEETRGVFQSGNAAFMRNWPYAWKLANAPDSLVRGKIGLSVLPQGDAPGSTHSSVLGGWSLAVSKYSHHREAAIDLVRYLASEEEQKRRTLALGQNPTRPALYHDPELVREDPILGELLRVFEAAFSRPSRVTGGTYNRVSAEFWDAVHRTLSGNGSAEENLRKLKEKLMIISRKEKW